MNRWAAGAAGETNRPASPLSDNHVRIEYLWSKKEKEKRLSSVHIHPSKRKRKKKMKEEVFYTLLNMPINSFPAVLCRYVRGFSSSHLFSVFSSYDATRKNIKEEPQDHLLVFFFFFPAFHSVCLFDFSILHIFCL